MNTCDEIVTQFYNAVTGLVDTYLPMLTVKRHSSDKLWVTDRYRRLIRCRQNALRNNQLARYKSLPNQVQRLNKQLRRKFYAHKISQQQFSQVVAECEADYGNTSKVFPAPDWTGEPRM